MTGQIIGHNIICTPRVPDLQVKLLDSERPVQEFDLEIKYKRGSDNVVADYLSRHM